MSMIPKNKPVWVYCGVGLRGYLASNILKDNGYDDVHNLIGGLRTYKAATAPVPTPADDIQTGSQTIHAAYNTVSSISATISIDACGLQCPGPIIKLKQNVDKLKPNERLEVKATDAGFLRDAESWCNMTGNKLLSKHSDNGVYSVIIEKCAQNHAATSDLPVAAKDKTFIMFSDDLDKALATFVLANGAAAAGGKVTIFFTFWGLNVIKKDNIQTINKDIWGKMFGMMLPSSSLRLKLSKMNMLGIGAKMMRHIMTVRGVDSLEKLRRQAIDSGVEFVACQMSMDVMGIKREELIDGVTIGGVATYMERADKANVNLFI